MGREMINLSTAFDMVLRGRPAQAADVPWYPLEHCPEARHSTAGPGDNCPACAELQVAQKSQKESYQDSKVKYLASYPHKGGAKGVKGGDSKGVKGDKEGKGGKKGEDRESIRKEGRRRSEGVRKEVSGIRSAGVM